MVVHYLPGRGARGLFRLLIGAVLGLIMQRGRFCFFCIFSDLIQERDSRPFYSILTALAVGSLCYVVIFTAFLPNAGTGRLPPDVHSARLLGADRRRDGLWHRDGAFRRLRERPPVRLGEGYSAGAVCIDRHGDRLLRRVFQLADTVREHIRNPLRRSRGFPTTSATAAP